MPQGVADDRLRNRKRPLIDPDRFDPLTFDERESLFGMRILQLDVSRHIDDLLTEMYRNSRPLRAVMEALMDLGARAWPKQLKQ